MRIIVDYRAWTILILCLLLSLSCGGKVTTRPDGEELEFTINGVLVKDRNLDEDFAYLNILRNSDPYTEAVVQADTHVLTNQGNGNYYKEGPSLFDFGQNVSVTITCPDDFTLGASAVMPNVFHIDPLPLSGDTLNPGGKAVRVTWTASASASGYILSVTTPDVVPSAVGYVAHLKGTVLSIPHETFTDAQDDLVQGVYEVYVVAYHGGFPQYPEMPFELPDGLPTGNINDANGTIGAGVIAEKARIRVP